MSTKCGLWRSKFLQLRPVCVEELVKDVVPAQGLVRHSTQNIMANLTIIEDLHTTNVCVISHLHLKVGPLNV